MLADGRGAGRLALVVVGRLGQHRPAQLQVVAEDPVVADLQAPAAPSARARTSRDPRSRPGCRRPAAGPRPARPSSPARMTPSPNAAGGGSSMVCSIRAASWSEVADLGPGSPSSGGSSPASPATISGSRPRCRRDGEHLARIQRALGGPAGEPLQVGQRPNESPSCSRTGPPLHQPADGVVASLDRRPVEQRLGQPAPQHPRAHRRVRQVDRRQQRALALAVPQALGQLQAAPGGRVQHH